MATGKIGVGDLVAVTATVRWRINPGHVSVAIPSYNFPYSIRDSSKMTMRGQQVELTGEVTRIDNETVTIALGPLVTVALDKVRLVDKYRPPKRKKPLRDLVD
ncbi:hypothetical protein D3227_13285 [Mesorhizobium waimense]|uniref:Uncharacterized protein n=1 Tax=Mesorhizobium waimense TaxID=1300307 RepID=A0A3A5KSI0_9HYPH|nr:hypothetical protein [Mesorhizobium waimense]RJT39182.1 hypothetical protein D3227_13285 [Mesorhizobium waimense]